MTDKYTFLAGFLSPEIGFHVTITGPIGIKELECLISKLEREKSLYDGDEMKTKQDAEGDL